MVILHFFQVYLIDLTNQIEKSLLWASLTARPSLSFDWILMIALTLNFVVTNNACIQSIRYDFERVSAPGSVLHLVSTVIPR